MANYPIKGKSGKEYIFKQHNIEGDSVDAPIGVYILANRIKDVSISSKSFYQSKNIFGITDLGRALYNPTGHAASYLYHSCENVEEVKEILIDLDEDENFKISVTDVNQQ